MLKHLTRRLERAYAVVNRHAVAAMTVTTTVIPGATIAVAKVDAARTAWYNQCRTYRLLRRRKCTDFWRK